MKSDLDRIRVAVTGLSATDNPYPGLGIIRCLRMAGGFAGKITALVFDPLSTGIFCDGLIDDVYQVPYPASGAEILFQRIREIHEQRPLDVIIPSLDSEVILYAELHERLAALGIRLLLPSPAQVKLRAKHLLYEFGLAHGITVPETAILNSPEQVKAKAEEIGIPFVLKASLNDAAVCSSVDEGEAAYARLLALWGYPILMQRFISGQELDVIALADRNSRIMGAVAMKKFGLTDKGKAFAGVTIEDTTLVRRTADILKRLRWVGPAECEFVRDRSGTPYLLEVNSRFPSWLFLAAAAGQNLPLMTVRLAMELPVEPLRRYETGKLFIRTVADRLMPSADLLALAISGEVHR